MDTILAMAVGYGVGSLPLGFVMASRATGVDLRRAGSGNVGAANVQRTAGLPLALLVLLIDMAKGAGSVVLGGAIGPGTEVAVAAGVAAIVGHVYPMWLRFRGGKGVAVGAGVFSLLAPLATGVAAVLFVMTVALSRFVSLGSLVAVFMLPLLTWMTGAAPEVLLGSVVAAAFIIERHRTNVGRLFAGNEYRLGRTR
ncbi:MAG: glycerol-3-phosphate 1-O-acyltransferase PlsY [Acidobacteriota bacterium]